MTYATPPIRQSGTKTWALRLVLFVAAVSLAVYIPYKYATQLQAIGGIYAFLFPLSSILAMAGIALSLRPRLAFDCNVPTRAAIGALSVLWMATGLLCVKTLTLGIVEHPGPGLFAFFHMLVQHVVLSAGLLLAAFAPTATAHAMGVHTPTESTRATATGAVQKL